MIETTCTTGTRNFSSRARQLAITCVMLAALAANHTEATGQTFAPSSGWLTGDARVTANRYATTIVWVDAPLRDRLMTVAKHQRIAVFLDRRVDPGTTVTISQTGVTFEQFLWALAAQLDLDACRIGDVYYLGPPATAQRLPVIAARVHKDIDALPSHEKPRATKLSNVAWPPLTDPEVLLRQTMDEAGIVWPIEVEHDVWAGGNLPEMEFADRLTLLLAGFGLAANLPQQLTEPLEPVVALTDVAPKHLVISQSDEAKTLLKAARKEFKGIAQLNRRGSSITGSGTVGDLARVRRWLVEQQTPVARPADQNTFTMNGTTATRLQILRKVADSLNRQLAFVDEHQTLLSERVTLNVSNVSIDELLEEILSGAGLSADLSEPGKIMVR